MRHSSKTNRANKEQIMQSARKTAMTKASLPGLSPSVSPWEASGLAIATVAGKINSGCMRKR
jgi:hypothetical protein